MAIQRTQLYSKIWKACDEMRGGMDASQYKDYILPLLALKYATDKQGQGIINIKPGGSFNDLIRNKGKDNIGEIINDVFGNFAKHNGLGNMFRSVDFNDDTKFGTGKSKVNNLSELIAIFEDPALNLKKNKAIGDDILGDAYEYLIKKFAQASGKSKGEFFTPTEVSRVLAKLLDIPSDASGVTSIYDPTCGSGSLLLKAADTMDGRPSLYGQEKSLNTTMLAKLNMLLHEPTAVDGIKQGDTLAGPLHLENETLKLFDYIVANPPFSQKNWQQGLIPAKDKYKRFTRGIPPKKNGDYAFLLHILTSLKSEGRAAVVLPHGVLFRGNTEGDIRQNIVKSRYIEGIIGLPANLFVGTGIPACIIVLDKKRAAWRKHIFMVDASQEYRKEGPKNQLRERDIHKITDTFLHKKEIPNYARKVPLEEIERNDYNLNLPRYIHTQEEEDWQNIEAHLQGGIPAEDIQKLAAYWNNYPGLQGALLKKKTGKNFFMLRMAPEVLYETLTRHAACVDYAKKIKEKLAGWWQGINLKKKVGSEDPKKIIIDISDELLATFIGETLVDRYAIYQCLMDYWHEKMQDDMYSIMQEDWRIEIAEMQSRKNKDWDCALLPKALLIKHYFAASQHHLKPLNEELEAVKAEKKDFLEPYLGDEGMLCDLVNQKGEIIEKMIKQRLKAINQKEDKEEYTILKAYQTRHDREYKITQKIKKANRALAKKVAEKYKALDAMTVKAIVIEHKWWSALSLAIEEEANKINQQLAERLQTLTNRYAMPLRTIESRVKNLTTKVSAHLQKMGFNTDVLTND